MNHSSTSKRRGRKLLATAAVGLAALVGGGVAFATIPGADGVIHGCFARSGGALRIIDPAQSSCGSGESQLNFNQTGPQGPKGDAGPQGPKGDAGPQGPKGDAGPQGMKGDAGPQGLAGLQGATGPQGLKGDTGAQGPAGPQGVKGDPGPAGQDGSNIISGYEIVTQRAYVAPVIAQAKAAAWCPLGKKPIGGGAATPGYDLQLIGSTPVHNNLTGQDGWGGGVYNGWPSEFWMDVYAICAYVSS